MEPLRYQLLRVARAYAEAKKLSISRVSTLLFNDGKKLDLIEGGADLGTERFEVAMKWLSANWPVDQAHPWPESVERPAAAIAEAAAL